VSAWALKMATLAPVMAGPVQLLIDSLKDDVVFRALEALDTRPVDVIISDIGLEGKDGLTLMRRVRERSPERRGSVPAIAVSAYIGAADRIRAFEAGCCDHREGSGTILATVRRIQMLYTLAVILLIAWLLGVVGTYTIGAFVHVLLVVALVLFIVGLMTGRRTLA
jgi:CheY-like chemotaxis protein